MSGRHSGRFNRGWGWWSAAWVVGVVFGLAPTVAARDDEDGGTAVPAVAPLPAFGDSGVVQAGCSSCGAGLLGGPGGSFGGCLGCGGAGCYPGREPCDCCFESNTFVGRLFGGLYECICCPDPCYEPKWNVLADAAFFVDAPRPVTQMRIRVDGVYDLPFPDKAEWFWPRSDGNGKLRPPPGLFGETAVDYADLRLYTEGAVGRVGIFVEMAYRDIDPVLFQDVSGFGDMNVGTKTLLLDCELVQLAFQFRTYIPTGNFTRGLGTGHVSLEPSLLMALKLAPRTYLQAQLAYLFPIGGDDEYEGSIVHYHTSLNHMLWNCGHDIQLVGVFEFDGYHILNGLYTDPFVGAGLRATAIGDIFSFGPGIRLNICDKIDFGVGSKFAISEDSIGDQFIRAEFRWRF